MFMDKLTTYQNYVQQVIQKYGSDLPEYDGIEVQYIFDTDRNHYQLFLVGWQGWDWIHSCIFHIDIKQDKIWLQHNGTELEVADEFVNLGVPKKDIVIGFHAPYKRERTEYGEG